MLTIALLAVLAFVSVVAVLAYDLRHRAKLDSLGLQAARRAARADIMRRVARERLANLDRLRVPASMFNTEDGRRRLADFHREDR